MVKYNYCISLCCLAITDASLLNYIKKIKSVSTLYFYITFVKIALLKTPIFKQIADSLVDFIMLGTIINTAAVVVGGSIGLFLKRGMPERFSSIYFQSVGLFTIAIGITMVVSMKEIMIVVSSLALGSLLGEWLNLEVKAENLTNRLKNKLKIGSEQFSEGLITSFLLFCMGSMTILGAIQEGTGQSSDLLMTKSVMDGFSAALLASAFGAGVIFSSVPLFLFQGGITLIAMFAGAFLSEDIILALTNLGGILLIGLGINILEIKKLRILNMLPSLIIVVLMIWIFK